MNDEYDASDFYDKMTSSGLKIVGHTLNLDILIQETLVDEGEVGKIVSIPIERINKDSLSLLFGDLGKNYEAFKEQFILEANEVRHDI